MVKRNLGIAAVFMSAALVLGCSSSNNNGSDGADGTNGADGADGTSMPSGGGDGGNGGGNNVTAFNGTWTIPCDGDSEFEEYEVVTITINGNSASSETFSYTDPACTQPDIPAVFGATVSLAYPGGTTNTAQGVATHINTTIESVTIDGAPPSAQQQGLLESFGSFDVEYDLVLVSGSNLYFGEFTFDLDGTTAAKRPNSMDLDDIAIRQ